MGEMVGGGVWWWRGGGGVGGVLVGQGQVEVGVVVVGGVEEKGV